MRIHLVFSLLSKSLLHFTIAAAKDPGCTLCSKERQKGNTMVFDRCKAVNKTNHPRGTQSCTECLTRGSSTCSLLKELSIAAEVSRQTTVSTPPYERVSFRTHP